MESSKENKIRFATLLGKLGMAFGSAPDKETMAVYFEFLSDRSMYQIKSAITQIIQTGDRFPSVAKLREIASAYREMKTVETSDSLQIGEFAPDHPKTAEEAMAFINKLNSAIDSKNRGPAQPGSISDMFDGPIVGGMTVTELADKLF